MHWKKEESRVIKLAAYQKAEAERKQKHDKHRSSSERIHSEKGKSHKNSSNKESSKKHKEIDYNALDYEQENQSDDDRELPKKQVPSLVQYPLLGKANSGKDSEQANGETDTEIQKSSDGTESLVQNTRSDALALALGVQIKTTEDPPTGEIKISGYEQ